jgi:hypothetical protein
MLETVQFYIFFSIFSFGVFIEVYTYVFVYFLNYEVEQSSEVDAAVGSDAEVDVLLGNVVAEHAVHRPVARREGGPRRADSNCASNC